MILATYWVNNWLRWPNRQLFDREPRIARTSRHISWAVDWEDGWLTVCRNKPGNLACSWICRPARVRRCPAGSASLTIWFVLGPFFNSLFYLVNTPADFSIPTKFHQIMLIRTRQRIFGLAVWTEKCSRLIVLIRHRRNAISIICSYLPKLLIFKVR